MTDNDTVESSSNEGPSDAELQDAVPPAASGGEVQVGIFVLVGIVATIAVLFLTTDPGTFRGRYVVTTTVENAGGVRNGDPVQMRGVNIGRVHGFDLSGNEVLISLEIEGEWDIPRDSRAELVSQGLLGGRTVAVLPGESDEALPPGGNMPGATGGDLMATADTLGSEASAALDRVRTLLAEPTVSSLRTSVVELNTLLEELSGLTREQRSEVAELTRTLNRTADNLESASEAGPDAARAIARADSALAKLNAAGSSLEGASSSLETVLERMERGEGTLGKLSVEDSLYVRLNRAVESVYLLATDVRENPGRYVKVEIF